MKYTKNHFFGVLILVFSIYLIGSGTGFFATLGGFSTLSLDRVSYTSNDPTLNKDAFLMTISQTGQGEYAQGTISASNLKSTDGTATKDITIRSRIEDYRCQYPIQTQTEKIYDYTIVDTCGKLDVFCTFSFRNNCLERGSDYYQDSSSTQYYCIQKTVIATKGLIGDSFFNFKTTFNVNIGGVNEPVVLTPQKTSAMSSDGKVNVAWTGNTVSGQDCPEPDNNDIGIVRHNNIWKTIDKSNIDRYTISHKTRLDTCFNNAVGTQGANVCILNVNLEAESSLANKKFTFANVDAVTTTNAANYGISGDGALLLNLDRLLQFPQYTLIVDADSLGIVKPVGTPKIISATGSTLMTGQTGQISVDVKNIGTGTGSFALTANCNSPFSYIGSAVYTTLQPSETDNKLLPIRGECNSDRSASCLVTLYDRNNPTKKDTKTVSMGCTPISICNTGALRCFGETEQKCIAGTHWADTGSTACEVIKPPATCQVNTDCNDGDIFTTDRCEGAKVLGVDTGFDKKCTHTDNTIFWIIGGVVFLLFIFFVALLIATTPTGKKIRGR